MGLFDSVQNAIPKIGGAGVGAALGGLILGPAGQVIGGANGYLNAERSMQGAPGGPDFSGQPQTPGYVSIRNKDGSLQDPYKVNVDKLGDTSKWQALAQAQNTANTDASVSGAQTKAGTGAQGAWSQLAMNGGLNSGAAERIAKQGNRDAMLAGQGARQEGANNALNIGLQGEQMNRAGDQFNIANQFAANQNNAGAARQDVGGVNQNNQFNYGEQMKGWTGLMNSQAVQQAANQPKGFLGSIFG